MKFNNYSIRAFIAVGALCSGFALPAISHATGAITLNTSTPVCPASSNARMDLTPNGDINIVCTASGPPACSVSGTSTIGAGQSVNVLASCNPAASTYAWTTTGGGPNIAGAGGNLTFPVAGTYTYAVTGTNGSGTGAQSAAATITVTNVTVAPVCTVVANPQNIFTGGSANITASCVPSANSFAWTVNSGGPAIGNVSAAAPTFSTAGSFTYTVVGTNGAGAGSVSNAVTINVTQSSGCSVSATGSFAANGTKLIAIERGGFVSYALPQYASPGRTLEILSIQSTASQGDLTSEFSISDCPGSFETVPAECRTWGTVNQSGTQLYATTNNNPVAGTCTLKLNTPYYINVRNTKYDRVTPACTPQTCYMNLQLNSY